jgi:general secretion pathway protein G
VRRFFARGRMFSILLVLLIFGTIYSMVQRERYEAGVRRTVRALSVVRPLVERYLLVKEGECPTDLEAVRLQHSMNALPRDGWGRPLRLVCPSVRPGVEYVLMSDGPDGKPGGIDRIED